MVFCEQCGNKLNEGAKFCGKCGTPTAAVQTEAHETSSSSACTQCGTPLEKGETFCANCGAKVGSAAQYQSASVQTQRQDGGGEVLKEGWSIYITSNNRYEGIGRLFLYRNRLVWERITLNDEANAGLTSSDRNEILRNHPEWVREMTVVIPIGEIESIKQPWLEKVYFDIKMFNKTEYRFQIANHEERDWIPSFYLAIIKSWVADIKSLCPHLR